MNSDFNPAIGVWQQVLFMLIQNGAAVDTALNKADEALTRYRNNFEDKQPGS